MRELAGISTVRRPRQRETYKYPDLLPIGVSQPLAIDGTPLVWRPQWEETRAFPVNQNFVDAVVKQVKANEEVGSSVSINSAINKTHSTL